jgi:Ca2+-binding EF-hand superfamily protein
MGNFEDEPIDESELSSYIQEGIQMKDLINLKKAFLSLDTNKDGLIEYDINKLDDINKFDLPVQEPNGKTILNFKQFMEIMIDNIKRNRKKFGNEATSYESETSTVLCFICPFKQ